MRCIDVPYTRGSPSIDEHIRGRSNERRRRAGIMSCVFVSQSCRLTQLIFTVPPLMLMVPPTMLMVSPAISTYADPDSFRSCTEPVLYPGMV